MLKSLTCSYLLTTGCLSVDMSLFRMLSLSRSVLLAGLLSFVAPVLLLSLANLGLAFVSQIPACLPLCLWLSQQLAVFLTVFGSGDPWRGALVISLTCALVGSLFESYAFFYQRTSPYRTPHHD